MELRKRTSSHACFALVQQQLRLFGPQALRMPDTTWLPCCINYRCCKRRVAIISYYNVPSKHAPLDDPMYKSSFKVR